MAVEGDLDPTFSGDGLAQHDFSPTDSGEGAVSLVIDPQGRIVVAGIAMGTGHGVVRYGPDGSPDPAFGQNGVSYFRPSSDMFLSFAAADLAQDGRLILTGHAQTPTSDDADVAVAAQTNSGQPDSSFGNDPPNPVNDAFVLTDLPATNSFDVPLTLALDAQNRILVAGRTTASEQHSFLFRYLPDGSLDPSFANGFQPLSTGDDAVVDIEIQPDGRLLALAKVDGQWATARFGEGGELDQSYGSSGIAALPGVESAEVEFGALALAPDGKVLAAIGTGAFPNPQGRLVRMAPDGTLDPSFATGGIAEVSAPGSDGVELGDLAIADDGRIAVAGAALQDRDGEPTAWRYLSNGQPDGAFGTNGRVTQAVSGIFEDVAIQPDRKLVLGGSIDIDASSEYDGTFATARLIGDATPPDTAITKAKKKRRAGQKAKFAFTAVGDVNTAFECAIKQPKAKRGGGNARPARFSSCKSPERTKKLKRPGKYRFLVRAIDPAGNVDATPAKTKLKVKPKPKRR